MVARRYGWVEDRDGVFQLVIDGVLVAVERVQGRDRDAFAERVAAGLQPRLVGLTGAARDEIQQPGPDVSVLVTGQINHAGELFRPPASEVDGLGGDVMPVGSGCGALPRLPVVGFHSPPAEPGVRLSPHRALHVRGVGQLATVDGVHGVGIW